VELLRRVLPGRDDVPDEAWGTFLLVLVARRWRRRCGGKQWQSHLGDDILTGQSRLEIRRSESLASNIANLLLDEPLIVIGEFDTFVNGAFVTPRFTKLVVRQH